MYEAWPFDCDAIAVDLGSGRPKVFIRKNVASKRRQRFTMGHELGHVVPAWHVGTMACTPAQASFDADPLGPVPANSLLSPMRITEQEAEANRFASALLVPRTFLEAQADHKLGDVVANLNVADVSAMAAILALAHSLLPGFCFLIDDDDEDDGYRLVTSSGTRAPAANGRRSQANQLHDKSHDSGETVVADRRVRWFQLASQRGFSIAEDGRGTTELLRESLTLTVEESRIPGLVMRINGIVGGMLSKDERAQTESQALAVLEHRFEMDPELQHLMAVPGFQLYLRRKAADRVNRCSSLRFAGQVRAGRRWRSWLPTKRASERRIRGSRGTLDSGRLLRGQSTGLVQMHTVSAADATKPLVGV